MRYGARRRINQSHLLVLDSPASPPERTRASVRNPLRRSSSALEFAACLRTVFFVSRIYCDEVAGRGDGHRSGLGLAGRCGRQNLCVSATRLLVPVSDLSHRARSTIRSRRRLCTTALDHRSVKVGKRRFGVCDRSLLTFDADAQAVQSCSLNTSQLIDITAFAVSYCESTSQVNTDRLRPEFGARRIPCL